MINKKKVCIVKMYYCEFFLEIRYLIWRYAELNRLLVGSSLIPLNIELKQDDRTVCCNHKIVRSYFDTSWDFNREIREKSWN